MTEEEIKALEKDILQVANDGAPCLLCENSFCDFRCEESDYNCVRCKLSGECKCAGCICNMHFELRKDYGLADEAPSAEDESGGWKLSKKYISKGLDTIDEIAPVYCDEEWAGYVKDIWGGLIK